MSYRFRLFVLLSNSIFLMDQCQSNSLVIQRLSNFWRETTVQKLCDAINTNEVVEYALRRCLSRDSVSSLSTLRYRIRDSLEKATRENNFRREEVFAREIHGRDRTQNA